MPLSYEKLSSVESDNMLSAAICALTIYPPGRQMARAWTDDHTQLCEVIMISVNSENELTCSSLKIVVIGLQL